MNHSTWGALHSVDVVTIRLMCARGLDAPPEGSVAAAPHQSRADFLVICTCRPCKLRASYIKSSAVFMNYRNLYFGNKRPKRKPRRSIEKKKIAVWLSVGTKK